MRTRFGRASAVLLGWLGGIVILASCASDQPNGPPEEEISVCHVKGSTGTIISIPRSELTSHLADGDYLINLSVSHKVGRARNGEHFQRITDALAEVRAGRLARNELQKAACRIVITVAPGVFHGSQSDHTDTSIEWFPLVVDVPDITLRGALEMQVDGNTRPTGEGTSSKATTLAPIHESTAVLIIANGHPGGSAGNRLTVTGFVLQSGHGGGYGIFSMRVKDLSIVGNRFKGGFGVPIDLRASSADIFLNAIGGTVLCDICLAGPGNYSVDRNLLMAGALEGILTNPAVSLEVPDEVEPYELPTAAEVTGVIINNEVRDHLTWPVGAGIRIGSVGLGAPDVHGSSRFTIQNNLLVNNRFAMLVEASFPGPTSVGDIDVTLGGNVMQQSCQTNLLVAFTRHTTGLLLNTDSPYEVNSTFTLKLNGDVLWPDVWLSHPTGYGNTLVVDGVTQQNGQRTFFDSFSCPGLSAAHQPVAGPFPTETQGNGRLDLPPVRSRR